MREDRRLQLVELPARLQTELPDECPPRVLIGSQRVGLPPRAVQREHEQSAELFAERLALDRGRESVAELAISAQCQLGLEEVLCADEPELLQPGRLARRTLGPGQRPRRESPPEVERPSRQDLRRVSAVTVPEPSSALGCKCLEPDHVDLVRGDGSSSIAAVRSRGGRRSSRR